MPCQSLFPRSRVLSVIVLSTLILTTAGAQTQKRVTAGQLHMLLKNDETLTKGIKTSEGATIHVEKTIPGGVVLKFTSPNAGGNIAVTGPPTIMAKNFWVNLVEQVVKMGNGITKGIDAGDGGGSSRASRFSGRSM